MDATAGARLQAEGYVVLRAAIDPVALSAELGKAGIVAQNLRTTCTITLEKVGEGFSVTASHLDLVAKLPAGASSDAFLNAAHAAETGCPISKLLKAKITLDARLEG